MSTYLHPLMTYYQKQSTFTYDLCLLLGLVYESVSREGQGSQHKTAQNTKTSATNHIINFGPRGTTRASTLKF